MYHCKKCGKEMYYDGICGECGEKMQEVAFVLQPQELLLHLQDIGNYKEPVYEQCRMALRLGLLDMEQMTD